MTHQITFTVDAAEALRKAGAFLALDPVRNNLVLTRLHGRVSRPEPGRYWTAHRGGEPLTQLQNSTSSSIYRRMGYRAIAEGIAYRFA